MAAFSCGYQSPNSRKCPASISAPGGSFPPVFQLPPFKFQAQVSLRMSNIECSKVGTTTLSEHTAAYVSVDR